MRRELIELRLSAREAYRVAQARLDHITRHRLPGADDREPDDLAAFLHALKTAMTAATTVLDRHTR